MKTKICIVKIQNAENSCEGILLTRPEVDCAVFYISNDGTFNCIGGMPMGVSINPDINNCCTWNLGSATTELPEILACFNTGITLDKPMCMEGATMSTSWEGFREVEGVIDLETLLQTPNTPSRGLNAYLSGEVGTLDPTAGGDMICEHYKQDAIYSGLHDYHYHHGRTLNEPVGAYTGHRIGIELEVIAKNGQKQDAITNKNSNWFYCERDSSLDSYGVELITIPLLPEDAKDVEFWRTFTDFLEPLADSWSKSCCGLHIHIGREILGRNAEERSETLGKLLFFYHHIIGDDPTATQLNVKVYGRDRAYHSTCGKTAYGDAVKLLGKDTLKEKSVCENLKNGMIDHSKTSRYFDINIDNTPTIEFRKGRGSICAERIASVVTWSEQMIVYCKNTSWVDLSFADFIKHLRKKETNAPASLLGFIVNDR